MLQEIRKGSFSFFSPSYRMEAPLSMGTHLPRCVIVAHNGAHLIQAVQGFLLKPFSPFGGKQVTLWIDFLQPFELGATTYFPLNAMFNVIKIKKKKCSASYKRGTVEEFDILTSTLTDVNKAADLSRLVCYTCFCWLLAAVTERYCH